ncbi:MAG: hypothetical protein OSB26_06900 [Woeseiaceae bacterium]|nr:hypothetical protein [Woeseiaceae bacterium]
MRAFRHLVLLSLLLSALVLADDTTATNFSRIDSDELNQPRALQVAIVSYTAKDGADDLRVDLVGAIHVGDADYYAELNQRFENYESVLYELVAPEGTVITPETESKSAISSLQRGIRTMLGLAYQLEEVNYMQPNFVHADLTPDEMSASMDERGESLYSYFWQAFFAAHHEMNRDPLGLRRIKSMSAALNTDSDNPLKVMLAHDFADLDRFDGMFGENSASAIIGARNERAIEVLRVELDDGKRSIAIFYGAAHMRDLENRLLELGFSTGETTWVDAWVF